VEKSPVQALYYLLQKRKNKEANQPTNKNITLNKNKTKQNKDVVNAC